MHHEGEGAGPLVIKNKLKELPKGKFASVEARIQDTFAKQVGPERAKKLIETKKGDVEKAYRDWLANYIDSKIGLQNFCCDKSKVPTADSALKLFDLVCP
jgi:hypothetical protein